MAKGEMQALEFDGTTNVVTTKSVPIPKLTAPGDAIVGSLPNTSNFKV